MSLRDDEIQKQFCPVVLGDRIRLSSEVVNKGDQPNRVVYQKVSKNQLQDWVVGLLQEAVLTA